MKIFTILRSGLLVLTAALLMNSTFASNARAQQFRTTPAQMQNLLDRIETSTDRFSRSLDAALDRSRFNGTDLEDQANALVDELEFATDRLEDGLTTISLTILTLMRFCAAECISICLWRVMICRGPRNVTGYRSGAI